MNIATQSSFDRNRFMALAAGWGLVLLATVVAYWPGLSGPFLFDDYGSIADLGIFGGISDWDTFKKFVFGGHAGPTGRPIALLSFLIDGTTWPTDPWPFKRTNLVIHLLNGILLGMLIVKVLRLLQYEDHAAQWIALAATACWLLHPFLVSTTLYAVQRMAQLSTMFMLGGLNVYLIGRAALGSNAIKAYLIMSLSVVGFTLLAMFSKENGILLPLLIGVIEFTIFASQRHRLAGVDRIWMGVFVLAPSLVIFAYLSAKLFSGHFFEVLPPREFSLYERVLTQPRVLLDYLQHWFIPELYTTGVFQDHFIKSTGLFSPVTTALSLLVHATVISLAIALRRKFSLCAFAVLFFYANHLLESSVINLELYFEHRNYLAAAFLFVPLLALLWQRSGAMRFWVATLLVLLILGGFTRYSATIWQDFSSIVEASARKAPTSARAQAQYATQLFNSKRYDESVQVLDEAIRESQSERPLLLVNRLIVLCNLDRDVSAVFASSAPLLSAKPYDPRSVKLYSELLSSVINGKCKNLSVDTLRSMFAEMLKVPRNADPSSLAFSQIQYFIGVTYLHMDNLTAAVQSFDASLNARPGAQHAMIMAAHLATAGKFEEAIAFSDKALAQLDVVQTDLLQMARVKESDILEFQAIVKADQEAAAAKDQAGL